MIVDHRPTGDDRLDHDILEGCRDLGVAVLLGDHLDDPVCIDRLDTAQRTVATGVATIATVTGRGRDADARSRLTDGFVDAGVIAVLCHR